jgi:hypothetical protein
MQRVNEFNFYELAQHIHPLTLLSETVRYNVIFYEWFQARTALNGIFVQRPFVVSRSAASELYQAITEHVPAKWDDATAKLSEENHRFTPGSTHRLLTLPRSSKPFWPLSARYSTRTWSKNRRLFDGRLSGTSARCIWGSCPKTTREVKRGFRPSWQMHRFQSSDSSGFPHFTRH